MAQFEESSVSDAARRTGRGICNCVGMDSHAVYGKETQTLTKTNVSRQSFQVLSRVLGKPGIRVSKRGGSSDVMLIPAGMGFLLI